MRNDSFPIKIDDVHIASVCSDIIAHKVSGVVVTPNVDHMCRIYNSQEYRKLYERAELCICDSKILQAISFLKNKPIRNVVRGSDLTVELLRSITNERVLIVGSDSNQKELIKNKFKIENIELIVPSFGFVKNEEEFNQLTKEINEIEWDIGFFAVGSPQQELLAFAVNNNEAPKICCGNAINFAVENVKRSPKWMSEIGAEWLYRIIAEPKRMIPRYFKNLSIFYYSFFKDKKNEI